MIGNNYSGIGPERGKAYIFYDALVSQADTKLLQANPTLASGDFTVYVDGTSLGALDTTPSVDPAASKCVKFSLSAAEMEGDNVVIVCSDASGTEWCDKLINIQTSPGGAEAQILAAVNTSAFAPTTTEFETADITEATTDHFKGAAIAWRSGNLKDQRCAIKAYSLVSGKGHFTVSTMTEAPASTDRFVIV